MVCSFLRERKGQVCVERIPALAFSTSYGGFLASRKLGARNDGRSELRMGDTFDYVLRSV